MTMAHETRGELRSLRDQFPQCYARVLAGFVDQTAAGMGRLAQGWACAANLLQPLSPISDAGEGDAGTPRPRSSESNQPQPSSRPKKLGEVDGTGVRIVRKAVEQPAPANSNRPVRGLIRSLPCVGIATLAVICLGLTVALAEPGISPTEIRVGQTMPYSGPLSAYAAVGKASEAYFDKVNAEGGINGRKIKLISLDDAFSPPKTVEQTRKLVEQEDVLLMFGSLGSATNNAVHRYLNSKKIPQLFLTSGGTKWSDPKAFPWTMPGMASYKTEGGVYGKHVLQKKPDAKIAILSQNDDFGKDFVQAFKEGLGARASEMIVSEKTYESADPTITSQISAMKASGANVLFGPVGGKFGSQLIRGVAEMGWRPDIFIIPINLTALSILEPAGLENATGLISSIYQKPVDDPQFANDPDVKAYYAFLKQYMPAADPRNTVYIQGYLEAILLVQVLKQCGDDLSRENVLRQATSLHEFALPLLLPGVTVSTSPDDYFLFKQFRLSKFNGKNWVGFGELINSE